MPTPRNRFDNDEIEQIAKALNTEDLWPYQDGHFAPMMQQASDMISEIFSTGDKTARMIPTSSGTSSIQVALGGLQIPPGTEVIVTPMTDPGSVTPILFHNTIPVFADIDPVSGLITPDSVAAVLTPRTSAVIAVHLTGSPVDVPGIRARLDKLNRPDVKIIEDVAQGLGANLNGVPLGMLGDVGCFSLNTHKHITVGEGGFVLASDDDVFLRCHNYSDKHRNRFGAGDKTEHAQYKGPGHSLRMGELRAAMLVAQLPKLTAFAKKRNAFGTALDTRLRANSNLMPQSHLKGAFPTFFGYMFTTQNEYDRTRKQSVAGQVNTQIRPLGSSMGGSYNYKDLPIYEYPLFRNRQFTTVPDGDWPGEVMAIKRSGGEIQEHHYDYTKVSLPGAESYLKRAFWVRMKENQSPADAEAIADIIINQFNAAGMS